MSSAPGRRLTATERRALEADPDYQEFLSVLASVLPADFPFQLQIGRNKEWRLNLRLAVSKQGRVEVYRLELEPTRRSGARLPAGGITSRLLRELHIPNLIKEAVGSYHGSKSDLGKIARRVIPAPGSGRGRRGYSDDHYEWIARSYLKALEANPQRPIAWLRMKGNLGPTYSASLLGAWVRKASELGFLGPAKQGKAGREPGPKLKAPRGARAGSLKGGSVK